MLISYFTILYYTTEYFIRILLHLQFIVSLSYKCCLYFYIIFTTSLTSIAENIPSVLNIINSSVYTFKSKHIIYGMHDKNDPILPPFNYVLQSYKFYFIPYIVLYIRTVLNIEITCICPSVYHIVQNLQPLKFCFFSHLDSFIIKNIYWQMINIKSIQNLISKQKSFTISYMKYISPTFNN